MVKKTAQICASLIAIQTMPSHIEDEINKILVDPCDLTNIGSLCEQLDKQERDFEAEISSLQSTLIEANNATALQMQSVQFEFEELFERIENTRTKAVDTEGIVLSMTADIKRLDYAKQNIAATVTMLKRLQMLTTAYDQLAVLAPTKDYKEISYLLLAISQLMTHFQTYRGIEQIAQLSQHVSTLQNKLQEQIITDFQNTIPAPKPNQAIPKGSLASAAVAIDALGKNPKQRLIDWFLNVEFKEYNNVFRGNDEASGLDNVSRRYAWAIKTIRKYEMEYDMIFPREWNMLQIIVTRFCEITREDLKEVMSKQQGKSIRIQIMLTALQETVEFENTLERKFEHNISKINSNNSNQNEVGHSFNRTISKAFEPYLSLYIDSQEQKLSSTIQKYKLEPLYENHADSQQSVVQSSADLFTLYRQMLNQCSKLSTSQPLLDLSRIFEKYLVIYIEQILKQNSQTDKSISLQNLCLILNTGEYCQSTTKQLEEHIKARIESRLASSVSLNEALNHAERLVNNTILILVNRCIANLEFPLKDLQKIPWSQLRSVGDANFYAHTMASTITTDLKEIAMNLSDSTKQQYLIVIYTQFIEVLENTLVSAMVKARPLTESAAEQMLLDIYTIQNSISGLPLPNETSMLDLSGFDRIITLLKVVMTQAEPDEGLVQNYLFLVKDANSKNFGKVLELKGIHEKGSTSRTYQHLQSLLQQKKQDHTDLVEKNLYISSISFTNSIGSPLIGASESPSGISTPNNNSMSSINFRGIFPRSSTPDGTTSHSSGGKVGENIRNIGKLFRREISKSHQQLN